MDKLYGILAIIVVLGLFCLLGAALDWLSDLPNHIRRWRFKWEFASASLEQQAAFLESHPEAMTIRDFARWTKKKSGAYDRLLARIFLEYEDYRESRPDRRVFILVKT